MKKILAVLLCGALLLVGGLPVLAQESSQGPMEPAAGLQDPYVIGREAVVQSAELLGKRQRPHPGGNYGGNTPGNFAECQ